MALYLNNIQNNVNNHKHQDTIIHSYNKQYFSNYDNAYETLANKIMLPGEVTFAYYYDSNSPSGQNAIFAVGPLTQGYNIVFKNSNEIDNIKNKLYETIADVNTSISYIENTIENKIIKNDASMKEYDTRIDSSFIEILQYINTSVAILRNQTLTNAKILEDNLNASINRIKGLIDIDDLYTYIADQLDDIDKEQLIQNISINKITSDVIIKY